MLSSNIIVAAGALAGILLSLVFRHLAGPELWAPYPVLAVVIVGGGVLLIDLARSLLRGQFGADLLAGLSIVTSVLLGEYLAGALVVLMLAGGEALEEFAMERASSVLDALAKRMPSLAHRRNGSETTDIPVGDIRAGDELVVLPHEFCPVDGVVVEGSSSMDESYLTGEPYPMPKVPGGEVISGAVNGDGVVVVRASREAKDSRYARIMIVMHASRQSRPRMRRVAEKLGAFYTPLAVGIAALAWVASGDPTRFLAVLVVATPCPLIIAIPVAIIAAISWCARRGIIIRDPTVLERACTCDVLVTDKTGTLTIGQPVLVEIETIGISDIEALRFAATLETYSKHPLARPILMAARERGIKIQQASGVEENPGQGLHGLVLGRRAGITGRKLLTDEQRGLLSPASRGLECILTIDDEPAALFRFRDEPRRESKGFVAHLPPLHGFRRVVLLSGDRQEEVGALAEALGISILYAGKSPEEKVAIVKAESQAGTTLYLGDGINDAPALVASHVGVAFGPQSDITSEAAGAVIVEPSLQKVDQLLHISRHLRTVALQSAVGGMAASAIAMGFAAFGLLSPVAGALTQEVIDLIAVSNALRAARLPGRDSDM